MSKNLRKILKKINGAQFTSSTAREAGLSAFDLQLLLELKFITRVARGIYLKTSAKENINEELVTSLIQLGEPSCICLLSALYFYGVTDEIPNQTWIYVPYEKSSRLKSIKLIRKRNCDWKTGISIVDGVRVTTIERTLIECLTDKKHFTQLEAVKLTKIALSENLTTIEKLLSMSKKLKLDSKVKMVLTMIQESYV